MKKNQKYITYIFIVFFLIIFSIFNFDEYKNFHQDKIEIKQKNLNLHKKVKNFKLQNIKTLNDVQFYYTPNKKLLEKIILKIEKANNAIFLETYILTERKIQKALIKANKRGINVKVILEKAPYKAYNINNKAYNNLKQGGINVVWSDKSDYILNHSKILLIDNLSIISTGNYSYSTFTKNRDFFIFSTDKHIYLKLKENFNNDFKGDKTNIYDNNLIFSPTYSRIKFQKMFNSANKNIKMYFQYIKDDELINLLIKIKKEKNIDISILIPESASNEKNTIKLKNEGINIKIFPKYKIHAKAILIDEQYLFIGSINFSNYSLDANREIGILINNNKIINNFIDIYNKDIKKAY